MLYWFINYPAGVCSHDGTFRTCTELALCSCCRFDFYIYKLNSLLHLHFAAAGLSVSLQAWGCVCVCVLMINYLHVSAFVPVYKNQM